MALKRIVVVGCGSIGRRHARLLSKRPDVAVELCETNRDNLEKAMEEITEAQTYDSFEKMLQTNPDMVVVATPHKFHALQTIDALRAGAHVLCEKPMSDNLADARRMLEAAKKSNCVVDFGFTLHFHPAMQHIKELIQSGRLGNVVYAHWHVGTYFTLLCSVSRHQALVEGALMMDCAHQPDLLHWWFGKKPIAVYATGSQAGDLPLQSNPNVMNINIEYDRSLLATIHLNYVQHPDRVSCEIVGDKAWVLFDFRTALLQMGRHEDEKITTQQFKLERDSLYLAEHQAFIDAVDAKRKPESPASEAIVSMEIIDSAILSWKQQRRCLIQ